MARRIYKTGWHTIKDKNGISRRINYKPSNFKKKKLQYNKHSKTWEKPPSIETPKINKYYRSSMTYNYIAKKGARKGKNETIRIWIYTDKPIPNASGEIESIKERFQEENPFMDYIQFTSKIEGRELNEEVDTYDGQLNEWTAIFEIENKKTGIETKYKLK